MFGFFIHSIRAYVALILVQIVYQMTVRDLEFRFQPLLILVALAIGLITSLVQKFYNRKKNAGKS
ncbi:MAG: hypothetical protein EOM08_03420 [Clostridia bacterium]|nr:hypothetical protein [Clostridia bacterium]NCC75467.1 hypothetical protein [Clostridia bacterium]